MRVSDREPDSVRFCDLEYKLLLLPNLQERAAGTCACTCIRPNPPTCALFPPSHTHDVQLEDMDSTLVEKERLLQELVKNQR
jgi:hypothetical protein